MVNRNMCIHISISFSKGAATDWIVAMTSLGKHKHIYLSELDIILNYIETSAPLQYNI